ncbi:YdcF family protein [Dietzia sp. B32]|nr:ElyC/SanA/YdcF family protein [Dietzia sp. B32]UVE96445.1 YdcF family protein [Dietzia sp. B32]
MIPVRPSFRRRRNAALAAFIVVGLSVVVGLTTARSVLLPRTDSPKHVDAIIVVAGAQDDRYEYARHLAQAGVADRILVSRPVRLSGSFATLVDSYCGSAPFVGRDGRRIDVQCYRPDIDTTEGETTAANRIASKLGYESVLVVTYWGHVSRVRIYFEQCFEGAVFVTDTPRPLPNSRKSALIHETGGYFKALLSPAC